VEATILHRMATIRCLLNNDQSLVGLERTREAASGSSRPRGVRPASDPLQEFLLRGNRAARLLTEHIGDGTGRCSVCSQGGQVGHVKWPFQLATAAQRAAEWLAR
jgi:hypothetical protein